MIEGLKPYPSMKPSGCPWLGNIPGHWSMRRNGGLFAQRVEYGTPGLPILEVSLKTGVRVRNMDGTGRKQAMSDQSKYRCARHGDIAYNTMRMWQGAVGVSPTDGLISPAYVVAKPLAGVVSGYYASLFKTPMFMKEVIDCSRGIVMDRNRLYWDQFKQIAVPIFDSDEQVAIVRFLDHANRKIDGFIRSKRKLIGLLNEQKQAIIHRAVTRGLDPNVPLKPSGIPWLGDIPQHWEAQTLKSVCSIQSGITLGKDYAGNALEEYPYLRVANVQAGHVKLNVVKTIRVTKSEALRSMLRAGDVLMTEGGDPDKLGRGCVWEMEIEKCLHQNHVFAVRPNQNRLNPYFLTTLLGMMYARSYFQITAKQTTNLAATNKTKIGMFRILLPSIEEQRQVLVLINKETGPISAAIARTEREIALMQEYRTRLTADVVTGKLDVRVAAASLPASDESASVVPDADSDDLDHDEDADA